MEIGNLTHSHSQPGEMDRTPPGTPKKGGKMLAVRVQMLDDTVTIFQIQAKALGRVLFDQVCNQLNLLESDYFGLEYQEAGGTKYWLDLEKPVCRQIGLSLVDILVRFCVKFYTPDPSQLEEEFTRYLFCLQIKRDLSQGLLQCNSNTAALMASYIVQAECGDYVAEDYPDHRYLSSYKFVPNQDQELERRIMENHKKHAGQSPAEADLNLLETARRCELYGIKMHPAKDHEGCPLNLAVAHMGIVVFQNYSKINTFSWAKIRKISFKRKRFLVKLHPEGYGYYKDTVEFFFEGRNECKNFWKKCVENHGFFRCTMVKKVPRQKTRVLSRGSSFRYSGRTQKQIVDFVRENYVKRQTFQRSQSFRHSSSAHSSVANVGTSISAHPLLPLGDNAVVGTPASLSCGSMTLTSSPVHTADIHAGGSPSPPLTTSVSPGTSVTSSPQHVYPRESPCRRTGHRPTKVKHPPLRSHRAISPLSPTDAATAAGNRSASRSNDAALDARDATTSRNSLRSPEFVDFNDVYSNCYTSLRSLRNEFESEMIFEDGAKTDIFDLANDFLINEAARADDADESPGAVSKGVVPEGEDLSHRQTWHRSASCRDLCREEEGGGGESEREAGLFGRRRDRCRRKCYSAVTSKDASMERAGETGVDVRIYSSSYPGTTSGLSRGEVGGEGEVQAREASEGKYDSQEEVGLSHDDVSHDSYELLGRELDSVTRRGGEKERMRSCSWGSERGVSLSAFLPTESGSGSGLEAGVREGGFWSLESERRSKHRSESDFRNIGSANDRSGGGELEGERYGEGWGRGGWKEEACVERENGGFGEGVREGTEGVQMQKGSNWKNESESRIVGGKGSGGDKEGRRVGAGFGEDVEMRRGKREEDERMEGGGSERQRGRGRKQSGEESTGYCVEVMTSRAEERRRTDKRREKKEREDKFHEGFNEREKKEWEWEREKREINRWRSMEEELRREEEAAARKSTERKSKNYGNFQEIQFEKFERVVSNQFGRYSEFLTRENGGFAQERKATEGVETVCWGSRFAKEMRNCLADGAAEEKGVEGMSSIFGEFVDTEEWKNTSAERSRPTGSPVRGGARVNKVLAERTKSDPYNLKIQKRNMLMHQKSIDLTPQQSEETAAEYEYGDDFGKTSRSEHDIPYVLHKRHCMNGTAKNADFFLAKADSRAPVAQRDTSLSAGKKSVAEKSRSDAATCCKQKASSAKVAEAKKAGVQIINLDAVNGKAIANAECKKITMKGSAKSYVAKKAVVEDRKVTGARVAGRKEPRRAERSSDQSKKDVEDAVGREKAFPEPVEKEEPIYAEVCKGAPDEDSPSPQSGVPPRPPKRSSSFLHRGGREEKAETGSGRGSEGEGRGEKKVGEKEGKGRGEVSGGFGSAVPRRREESLTLFARTRLGVSEGSAFSAIVREGGVGSPTCQRRAKSLDAPYVSVHSLPPADAFSSKDDTVEGSEGDVVNSAVTRLMDLRKGERGKKRNGKMSGGGEEEEKEGRGEREADPEFSGNAETEADSVFTDDLDAEMDFKRAVLGRSKVEMSFGEERILDEVLRGKRLLSKIESMDLIDSEGDLDSSRMAEPPVVPSDRLVNLPESIRFPSVRQISGQTSEESADGWEQQKEAVKVKRRAGGRRSAGREEEETPGESVVWDSKDEEPPPGEEVWDGKLGGGDKYEGAVVNVGLASEYLKRGSCGQSIDDDNLSTPMKESSPEHWVSVDDLPEALEREEKLLKQQERILREKILNEKLKRELNLDAIDVDDRYGEYKDSARRFRYEEETLSLKENLKGHSLDTYELIEKKKSRERKGRKNRSSFDEELLTGGRLMEGEAGVGPRARSRGKGGSFGEEGVRSDYIRCKVVKDIAEMEEFGDNDDELEEFFVVLEENLEGEGDGKSSVWGNGDSSGRTLFNGESLISVPEEFKDVEEEAEEAGRQVGGAMVGGECLGGGVEIRLSEIGERGEEDSGRFGSGHRLWQEEIVVTSERAGSAAETSGEEMILALTEGGVPEDAKVSVIGGEFGGGLSPLNGTRSGSEEGRKPSLSEEAGRLSPCDGRSRRGSEESRKLSASEDVGRLSPSTDSRRGSEEPGRLSTSEDSRKCSASESVSEETRRRLSSSEETRRKRASLTKQCSVGADSLSDEVISGIQECSSSFEQDEKDVFEAEPVVSRRDEAAAAAASSACESISVAVAKAEDGDDVEDEVEVGRGRRAASESAKSVDEGATEVKEGGDVVFLAPPSSERELSRETEDSLDYAEGDFKDIRDAVKEKDMSEDPNALPKALGGGPGPERLVSSLEQSESSSENGELRYIDEKRGSTPEMIVGKSREAVAMSIVVVNEGLSVLEKLTGKDGGGREGDIEREPLPGIPVSGGVCREERHLLPKGWEPGEWKLGKTTETTTGEVKARDGGSPGKKEWGGLGRRSLDSSQESDLDRLSDISLVSHVRHEIARRNLSDVGRCLWGDEVEAFAGNDSGSWKTSSEDDLVPTNQKTSSEEKERTDQSSADESVVVEKGKRKEATKTEKRGLLKLEGGRGKRDIGYGVGKEKRSPDQEKRDSGEDGSSSSSAPVCPKRELSSTWKPFLLESSGSSSLEEGWLPPDENAHLADEEETSSTSNNQQDDSCHDDVDYPTGIGYPVLGASTAEMMVGGYGSVYALSRTLSRISERSVSEQERSDVEDDITKPSSHSTSVEEESILSSDRQPSLSSDPPSPKESASAIPDLPVDRPAAKGSATAAEDGFPVCEPFADVIPPPLPDEDWPSPPSSSSVLDTPVVSHVETFYMEIHPEEACKVVMAGSREEGNSSSDENQTLHEESEFLVLSSDNLSASTTTTTTQDGTVVIPVRPKDGKRGSLSEDASVLSTSDRSAAVITGAGEDGQDRYTLPQASDETQAEIFWSASPAQHCPDRDCHKSRTSSRTKPLKMSSPTTKTFGFFETPVSKVRSPTSQMKFFDAGDKGAFGGSFNLRSPTSSVDTTAPKTSGTFFDGSRTQISMKIEPSERRLPRSPTEAKTTHRTSCTPYYSNVADSAENSYFGRYDTGSLERTKIQSSRKCTSYYSVSRPIPTEGDLSFGNGPPPPAPNTIPRASKKTHKRHRVAMDLVVRDGRIVAPPRTNATVLDHSDDDRTPPTDSGSTTPPRKPHSGV